MVFLILCDSKLVAFGFPFHQVKHYDTVVSPVRKPKYFLLKTGIRAFKLSNYIFYSLLDFFKMNITMALKKPQCG